MLLRLGLRHQPRVKHPARRSQPHRGDSELHFYQQTNRSTKLCLCTLFSTGIWNFLVFDHLLGEQWCCNVHIYYRGGHYLLCVWESSPFRGMSVCTLCPLSHWFIDVLSSSRKFTVIWLKFLFLSLLFVSWLCLCRLPSHQLQTRYTWFLRGQISQL